jgi:predicted nicotinamide N-methyase
VAVEFRAGDPLGAPLRGFDVVLAGDVFYESDLSRRCLSWLRTIAASGSRALVGDPGRLYSPGGELLPLAAYDVPTTREIECDACLRTAVLEVVPAAESPERRAGRS